MQIFQLSRYEQNQFPLSAFRQNAHKGFPAHSHDFTELALVLAGEGVHVGPVGARPFQAGDVFVIEPGAVHSYRAEATFSIVNVMYDASRLRLPDHDFRMLPGFHALFHLDPRARLKAPPGAANLRVDAKDLAQMETLIDTLLAELQERRPGYQSMAAAVLAELIVFLSRRVQCADAAGRNSHAIGRALSCIERCYAEPLTLEELAGEANMSVRSLQRRFREAVGVTPFRRLLEVRISRAKALLRDPSLSVSQVAFMTGFRDSNYFCRQFRRLEGVPPSQVRPPR